MKKIIGEWASGVFLLIYKFTKGENFVSPVIIVALPNTYINKANQLKYRYHN
jgi:hypothetical protein